MLSETADLTEGVNMQTLIKFGSFTPISPRSYAVQRSDLDSEDSGRSETGVMFRNRIRAGVYKILVKRLQLQVSGVFRLLRWRSIMRQLG